MFVSLCYTAYLVINNNSPCDEKPIEMQSYFKRQDRNDAEEYLRNRVDGSCLVRPFKEQVNISIVNIYRDK